MYAYACLHVCVCVCVGVHIPWLPGETSVTPALSEHPILTAWRPVSLLADKALRWERFREESQSNTVTITLFDECSPSNLRSISLRVLRRQLSGKKTATYPF